MKLQTNGTTRPSGVNDDESRFPRKSNPLQKGFFIPIAQRSIEEDDTIISKVTKGKDKNCGQSGKTTKCAEEQNNELTESIRN